MQLASDTYIHDTYRTPVHSCMKPFSPVSALGLTQCKKYQLSIRFAAVKLFQPIIYQLLVSNIIHVFNTACYITLYYIRMYLSKLYACLPSILILTDHNKDSLKNNMLYNIIKLQVGQLCRSKNFKCLSA